MFHFLGTDSRSQKTVATLTKTNSDQHRHIHDLKQQIEDIQGENERLRTELAGSGSDRPSEVGDTEHESSGSQEREDRLSGLSSGSGSSNVLTSDQQATSDHVVSSAGEALSSTSISSQPSGVPQVRGDQQNESSALLTELSTISQLLSSVRNSQVQSFPPQPAPEAIPAQAITVQPSQAQALAFQLLQQERQRMGAQNSTLSFQQAPPTSMPPQQNISPQYQAPSQQTVPQLSLTPQQQQQLQLLLQQLSQNQR